MSTTTVEAPVVDRVVILHERRRDRDSWRWDSRTRQVQWARSPLELVRYKNELVGWPQFAILVDGQFITG